ncbi:MAG TPA: Mrp/NBP35 family ATP-binding protein [Longimicrobiales bacterium]|jgi:ATP-binding protein involved in chromosome partitioning
MELTREGVLAALGRVMDPELAADVASLGMVAGVDTGGGAVRVALAVPGARPDDRLAADAAAALRDAGARDVEVTFVEALTFPAQEPLPGVRSIVAVGSGKGGVGKSTVAANLAAALAREGLSVGLLDADIYGPSQGKMFGVEGRRLMADEQKNIVPLRNHGVKVISIANLVEEGQALTWRGPILHGTLTQLLKQTVWGELDVLVVDLPPGTGDVQLSLAQLVTVTGMVLVTTPQEVALSDVKRAYTMARKTHVPVLGLVENMSYYPLPGGERDYLFGEGGADRWAAEARLDVLGHVPIARALRESGDAGAPLVVTDPADPAALELRRAARRLLRRVADEALSSLPMA